MACIWAGVSAAKAALIVFRSAPVTEDSRPSGCSVSPGPWLPPLMDTPERFEVALA